MKRIVHCAHRYPHLRWLDAVAHPRRNFHCFRRSETLIGAHRAYQLVADAALLANSHYRNVLGAYWALELLSHRLVTRNRRRPLLSRHRRRHLIRCRRVRRRHNSYVFGN